MTCPITYSCYKVVDGSYISRGNWTFLHADLADDFKELKLEVTQDEPTAQTQALRAFFALEYLYFHLLPYMIQCSEHLRWKQNFQEQYDRSTEGLELLLRMCDQAERRIAIDKGTMALMDRDQPGHKTATMDKPLPMLRAVKASAEVLVAFTRTGKTSFSRVGDQLGQALVSTNQSVERCTDVIRTLLTISIHNPVSPCNMTRKYLV